MQTAAEHLKEELRGLDFEYPEQIKSKDLDLLITQMATHIGDTDPELRDKLIYSKFYFLIEGDYLDHQQMISLLETCLDENHLFYKIGLKNDDSLFTRAFSSLVIALILANDRNDSFLEKTLVNRAIECSIIYLQKEEDTRGYVEEKGWAHSIAHGADLLDEAIKHPLYNMKLATSCLETIGGCIVKETVYTDGEDERLTFAIEALLDKGMNETVLENWITSLSLDLAEKEEVGFSLSFFRKKTNVTKFFKTLYFRLMFKNAGHQTRKKIEEILASWHSR
jgi:hypothetical protein